MEPTLDTGEGARRKRQLMLFFMGAALLSMTGAVSDTTFNNYLKDTFRLGPGQRGALEFPREFPGFAVTLVAGALLFLPEVRVASVAGLAAAAGMLGLAYGSPNYHMMIAWMVLFSTGVHLMMPMESAIAIGLAHEERRGRRLGQVGMFKTAAALLTSVGLFFILRAHPQAYRLTFTIGACLALISAIVYFVMGPHAVHNTQRPRIVLRRRYRLYYVLCAFFGARKQIFLTFGPWVLVTVFGRTPLTFVVLYFVGRSIAMWFQPFLGRLVDRVGPRRILVSEAVLLIGVCLAYVAGLSLHYTYGTASIQMLGRAIPMDWLALGIIFPAYIMDDLLFAVEMARSTYAARLAPNRDELVGTLAAGVSINHAISVVAPVFGGLLWVTAGDPKPVFWVAAGIMACGMVVALFVRVPAAKPVPLTVPKVIPIIEGEGGD